MIISKKNILVASLFISLLFLGGITMLQQRKTTVNTRVRAALSDSISPTPTIFIPGPLKVEQMDSPDGTATFTMESQSLETHVQYSFYHTDFSKNERKLLFSEDLSQSRLFSIPFNAWSPDNIYVFLNDTEVARDGYIVFSVTGELFADEVRYLDIDELFAAKVPNFTITEVTGWAAPDLLLVNTTENEKGTKVSFWFNVKTQSFIRLSNYFY